MSGAGWVMLCVLVHAVHCMSFGSKDSAMFWCMCLVLSFRDARKLLFILCSVSKLPMCVL